MRRVQIFAMSLSGLACAQNAATNAQALRPFFDLAKTARVDVVGIGDSNQLQRSNGWDQGWHKALASRFGEYATGMISWGEGSGGGAGQGYRYACLSSGGSGFLYVGAPAEAATFLNNPPSLLGPHNYLFLPAGVSLDGNALAGSVYEPGCPIDINGPLRVHFSYGLFSGAGSGSFRPSCRYEAFPFDQICVGPEITTRTGDASAFRTAYGHLDVPAGMRNRQIAFRAAPPSGSIVGPFIGFFMRTENTTRMHGAAFSSLYAVGSKTSVDMALAMRRSSDETLTHYFEGIRRLQGPTKAVLVRINTGLNDRSEGRLSVKSGIAPGNSAAAYADNLQCIIDRLREIWTLNAWPAEELHFLLTPSQAVADPDEPSLRSYRDACEQLAMSNPRTATVRLDVISNSSELLANGWYQANGTDRNHLVEAAYDSLADRELLTLLRPPCIADFNVDGGVDGSDLSEFFEAWASGDFMADVNDDGGVDGFDAQTFILTWQQGGC